MDPKEAAKDVIKPVTNAAINVVKLPISAAKDVLTGSTKTVENIEELLDAPGEIMDGALEAFEDFFDF